MKCKPKAILVLVTILPNVNVEANVSIKNVTSAYSSEAQLQDGGGGQGRMCEEKQENNERRGENGKESECINNNHKESCSPNFIIMVLDDHGYGDVGIYDDTNVTTETPHIDELGKSGMQFLDYHSGASVCTPSRAALLTGRLGLRTGVTRNFSPLALGGLPPKELTIAELLPSPYRKHMIGKWHLGHKDPYYHPSFRGFDTFYGLPYSGDMGCLDMTPQSCKPGVDRSVHTPACPSLCNLDHSTRVGIPLYDTLAVNCSINSNSHHHIKVTQKDKYPNSKKKCDSTITEQPVNELTLNHRYAQRAKHIITKAATSENSNPFLLYIAFAHTHHPMAYDSEKWSNYSKRPGWKRHFGNTLAEVDDSVGQIVQTLHKYDGLANNTVVLLTSDNGPADVSKFDCDFIGSPGPFKGLWQKKPTGGGGGGTMKRTVWEGGHRVIFLASWPGTIRPGRISSKDDIISSLDILPTVLSLADIDKNKNNDKSSSSSSSPSLLPPPPPLLPKDRVYDGIDISMILKDESMAMSKLLQRKIKRSDDNNTSKVDKSKAKGRIVIGDNNDILAVSLGDRSSSFYDENHDESDGCNKIGTCNGGGSVDGSSLNNGIGDCYYHRVLFHPSMSGYLDAMRIGRYKLFFRTGSGDTGGCNGQTRGRIINHMPPLVFDLLTDPGESKPLANKELPLGLIDIAIAARKMKMKNIRSTLSHKANYRQGWNKRKASPCCNLKSDVCRCPWQQQPATNNIGSKQTGSKINLG